MRRRAPKPRRAASVRAAATPVSPVMSRDQLASLAGLTFGGKRDLYDVLGYQRKLSARDFRERFRRGGVAARVVEAYPHATWRGETDLVEDQDPARETPFELAWQEMQARLQVWDVFKRADVLAGLGRYAVVLIGAPGDMESELPASLKAEDVQYLQPYAEDDAVVVEYDQDESSPRFGRPLFYQLRRSSLGPRGGRGKTLYEKRAHWSRVLHVADGVLDDEVFGEPRMQRVWNDLDDLDKVKGAGAEAFWMRAHQGLHFDIDKDVKIEPSEIQKMKDNAEELAHQLRRTMATRGTKVTPLGSDVANFKDPVDGVLTLIAAATSIPKRILMGSEMGELASSQDKDNWDDRVSDRRKQFAEPRVVRPFVELMISRGAFPKPERYEVRWPEVEKLDDKEKAAVALQLASINERAGGVVVTPAEIRDKWLRLGKLEEDEADDVTKPAFAAAKAVAIVDVCKAVAKGELPREEAVSLLEVALGVSPDDADRIVPEEPEETNVQLGPDGKPLLGPDGKPIPALAPALEEQLAQELDEDGNPVEKDEDGPTGVEVEEDPA